MDESGRRAAHVHWWAQAAARTFAGWTFDAQPWIGVTGKKNDLLLLTSADDYTEERRLTGTVPVSSAYQAGSVPAHIIIRKDQAFGVVIAHEFAHGVLDNARMRLGTGTSVYRGESGALNEG